jgi:hypothetical protein
MRALASMRNTTGICAVAAVTDNQSLSGSTGIGALFGGAEDGGGTAVMTSEFIDALASGGALGFAAVALLAAGGVVTTGAEVTVFGTVLIAADGNGFAAG